MNHAGNFYGEYRSGYVKAMLNVKEIFSRYDMKYWFNWSKENSKDAVLKSSFTKKGVMKTLKTFEENSNTLLTWGSGVEFGMRANTGDVYFVSRPDVNGLPADYVRGYREAISDIIEHFKAHEKERIFTQKRVVSTIGDLLDSVLQI